MLRENLKVAFEACHLIVKEVASKSGVKKATIDNWLAPSKTKEPRAIDLYAVCRAVHITVEQAIDGEVGLEYVRSILKDDGSLFKPPDRIADIVRSVLDLTDDELIPIRGAIDATLAAKKREQQEER
jgi:transcriptional regulator with XRE-family HTH domain